MHLKLPIPLFLTSVGIFGNENAQGGGGGGGVILGISRDGDERRIFLGRKIWQVFFWVARFQEGFFGDSKQPKDLW